MQSVTIRMKALGQFFFFLDIKKKKQRYFSPQISFFSILTAYGTERVRQVILSSLVSPAPFF